MKKITTCQFNFFMVHVKFYWEITDNLDSLSPIVTTLLSYVPFGLDDYVKMVVSTQV